MATSFLSDALQQVELLLAARTSLVEGAGEDASDAQAQQARARRRDALVASGHERDAAASATLLSLADTNRALAALQAWLVGLVSGHSTDNHLYHVVSVRFGAGSGAQEKVRAFDEACTRLMAMVAEAPKAKASGFTSWFGGGGKGSKGKAKKDRAHTTDAADTVDTLEDDGSAAFFVLQTVRKVLDAVVATSTQHGGGGGGGGECVSLQTLKAVADFCFRQLAFDCGSPSTRRQAALTLGAVQLPVGAGAGGAGGRDPGGAMPVNFFFAEHCWIATKAPLCTAIS